MNNFTKKLPNKVLLCSIGYLVSEHEGLIVFSEDGGFYGTHTRISFFKEKYSNWHVEFSDTFGSIPACHILEAYKIVIQYKEDDFGRPLKEDKNE